jgi:cell fate regulator YaaT (PSP1 superfamily)
MGCTGCTVKTKDGKPMGCQSNGGCGSGGCNRLNTYDWLSTMELDDVEHFDIAEVSFKNGARKYFFRNPPHTRAITGDMVVVESTSGFDIGQISLSGELVRLQLKKKRVDEEAVVHSILRRANERDLERLEEARNLELQTMVRARVIARTLGLDMKIGDVEFQGDKRKATFYYTADGRVDFRELIRHYAREFRVKIEMRQIGARQESARIGGLGSCGRELCCSTWLTDFKSVSTAAARYQNLAINQAKLSGQCGRLKCCLNYELDTYMDALDRFPKQVDKIKTEVGVASLVKTDIFKGLMFYCYEKNGFRGKTVALDIDRVKEIKAMNDKDEFPADLIDLQMLADEEPIMDYASVNNVIELPPEEKKRKKRRSNRRRGQGNKGKGGSNPKSKAKSKGGGNNPNRKKSQPQNKNKKGPNNNNQDKS